MDDDGHLIRKYLQGDVGAFDDLVRRHSPAIYAFILYRVRERALAEDVLQDVFVRMLTHLHEYQHRGKLRAWLFRIAHNLVADSARRSATARLVSTEARLTESGNDGPSLGDRLSAPERDQPDRIAERREMAASAHEALAYLAPPQRDVFLMRQAGLSFKEIARIQRCPINTALGRMHDAVRALRRRLKT